MSDFLTPTQWAMLDSPPFVVAMFAACVVVAVVTWRALRARGRR